MTNSGWFLWLVWWSLNWLTLTKSSCIHIITSLPQLFLSRAQKCMWLKCLVKTRQTAAYPSKRGVQVPSRPALYTMRTLPALLSCGGIAVKYTGSRMLVGSQSRQLMAGMGLDFCLQLVILVTHHVVMIFVFLFSKTIRFPRHRWNLKSTFG